MPIEGDQRTHICLSIHILALLTVSMIASSAFVFYASCAKNKKNNHSKKMQKKLKEKDVKGKN